MENRLPAALFIAGIFILLLAIIFGEAKAGIFIIFPFFLGSGFLSFLGIFLIFLSFLTFIFSFHSKFEGETKIEKKGGGILFIGPIPIIFSSNMSFIKILGIIAAIFLFFILIIILFRQLFPF